MEGSLGDEGDEGGVASHSKVTSHLPASWLPLSRKWCGSADRPSSSCTHRLPPPPPGPASTSHYAQSGRYVTCRACRVVIMSVHGEWRRAARLRKASGRLSERVPTVHSAADESCSFLKVAFRCVWFIYLSLFIYLFRSRKKKTNFFCQNTTTKTTTIIKIKLHLLSADSLFLSDVTETKRKKSARKFNYFIYSFSWEIKCHIYLSIILFLVIIILYSLRMCVFSFHLCGSMYSQILIFLYHSEKNYNKILLVQMKNVLLLPPCEVTKGKATQSYNPPPPPPCWDIETWNLNDKTFSELLLARLPVNLITYLALWSRDVQIAFSRAIFLSVLRGAK